MKKKKIIVSIIAHDRWIGPSVVGTRRFGYKKNAEKFCKDFNSKNVDLVAPEYYEIARID